VSYDDTTGNRTVTNALGQQETYKFAMLQNVPKVTEIDRLATATTAAATRKFTYDANGYTASATDWNGNLTTYINDVHGQPTTIVEASGTPQGRTTTITYLPNYHLPTQIVTPGLTSAFTYDANGELLIRTLTDTTATIAPYSTNGTARTWTYTWGNFLLASVKGPRTDLSQLTSFTYDASGALTKTTNALGQKTQITAHTGGGLPLTVVDPNGVTTNLTYNARQWLLTNTLSTTAGPLTTTLAYDATGNLVKTTLPDGAALTNSYDTAHRLTAVTDLFSQSVSLTLDANGDPTETNLLNSASTVERKHSGIFDALGRMLDDIRGVGQTTAYNYDANGNPLTVTDPLARVTQKAFDPLNRLIRIIDAAGGITKIVYDPHNRPVTVVDPNSGSTTFVYDGFGDVIQRISPDTGKTVYHYDLAGNLTQKVDATGATTNFTYDALNRPLTRTYPGDAAENVAYSYDQAGHGFGIGRLTSVTDAAGSLSRSYDERGNMLKEKRVHGAATLLTSNTYDSASRVSSITYPSGWKVAYTRDAMGRITATNATSPGGATQSIASGIAYQPFGPVKALTFGNGVAETRSFDLDYRLLNLSDTGAAALQNLTYSYDAANNVLKITDGVTAANTQNLGYDVLDHLTGATGNYGSLAYSYSPIGNRLTQTSGGILSNYTYAPHSNQLASIKTGAVTQTLTTTAAGNISGFSVPFGPLTSLTYNQDNRLATANSGAGQLAQYAYDGFGQRIVKFGSVTGTTLYQYDRAGHLLEENDGAGTSRVDYVYLDDQPVATIQPITGKVYFLHDDRLGTPQLATDASETVQWSASYQPFGYTSTGIGAIVQNLRLPGQEFDAETGLYHNGFRDYLPELGRYLQSDPIGLDGDPNTYQYAQSNPFKWVDPSGLYCQTNGNTVTCHDLLDNGPTVSFPRPSEWPESFNSDSANYHHYDVTSSAPLNCDVMQSLINNPTPGPSDSPATALGTSNDATPPGRLSFLGPSPVQSYSTTDSNGNPVVINVTQPGHWLHPGYVVRTIEGGTIHNYGEGTSVLQGPYDPWADSFSNIWRGQNSTCGCGNK
jgi:RHS repeat-associated protein